METLIILLHILIAVAIIAFVLLQQGKGAEAGASFGAGSSQTLFGSVGSWNFFSRVTAILAVLFFSTSFALAVIAKNQAGGGVELTPELRLLEEQARDDEVPALDVGEEVTLPEAGSETSSEGDIPALEPDIEELP